MVICLFNLSNEDLNIRIHLKTRFILIRSLLWGSSWIIWKMSSNKLNSWFFFYWELNKVLTSFINLAYWVLSQTSNTPENMSWLSLICLHLHQFGWGFPQKQFSKTGFFPPACSGLIPGWKLTSLLISLPWPCSFYWVICRPHTWKAADRMRSQNLLPFQGTCTLLLALPVASGCSSPCSSSAPWEVPGWGPVPYSGLHNQ